MEKRTEDYINNVDHIYKTARKFESEYCLPASSAMQLAIQMSIAESLIELKLDAFAFREEYIGK